LLPTSSWKGQACLRDLGESAVRGVEVVADLVDVWGQGGEEGVLELLEAVEQGLEEGAGVVAL